MGKPMCRLVMPMCAFVFALVGAPGTARAELGLGAFLGRPTGFDLKVDFSDKVAFDMVAGVLHPGRNGWDDPYIHGTILFQLANIRGTSVFVPFRLGVGAAIYDDYDGRRDNDFDELDFNLAARMPFEVGVRFRKVPIEVYGEVAARLELIDDTHLRIDGGVGVRFYL
jgi:hypothetical protein